MAESAPLPAAVDVAVIGGGIVGVSAALALAERGVSVALFEKGRVAGEQSSRNWGWIRKQGRDPRELPLALEADALWARWVGELDEEVGWARRGVVYLAEDEAELERRRVWLEAVRAFQLDSRLLSAAETARLLGRGDRRFAGALHTPSDATAEPRLAVPALARRAQALGAHLLEGCAVRAVEREAGAVRRVVTERGAVACQAAILAGGAWSRPFLENLGAALPQLAILSSAQRTAPAPEIGAEAGGGIGAAGASIRRRLDGGYTVARSGAARFELVPAAFAHLRAFAPMALRHRRIISLRVGASFFGPLGRRRWKADQVSPMERVRTLDPAPDARLLDDVMASARRDFPQLREARPVARWAGLIDVTPDELPIIDVAPGLPGLVIATGCSGHGFGAGPGVGALAAALATGAAPLVDPAPFRLSRLAPARAA